MSDPVYSRWYHSGTVSVAKGSATVTGSNTYWLNANVKPGDLFTIDDSKFFEIESVDSNIQLTLCKTFTQDTVTAGTYSIIRNFTATLPAETAAKTVECLAKYNRYVDEDMKTVQGKSAYEIACDKGYTGSVSDWLDTLNAYGLAKKNGYVGSVENWLESLTAFGIAKENGFTGSESDWLESLIGAGQWSQLNERTKLFINDGIAKRIVVNDTTYAGLHNSIARGKCLGNKITDEQWQAIKDGTFDDMWIGDWWDLQDLGISNYHSGARYVITCFNPCNSTSPKEDAEGKIGYPCKDMSNRGAGRMTDANLKPVADLTHKGGHIMLCGFWDNGIPNALMVKDAEPLTNYLCMNPQNTSNPQPNFYAEGRTNPESGFNKKTQMFLEKFENHVCYVPSLAASAFDENNKPTAFKSVLTFFDLVPMSFCFGRYPKQMDEYNVQQGPLYNKQMPLWNLYAGFSHHEWSAAFREQINLNTYYAIHYGNLTGPSDNGTYITYLVLR